MDADRMLAYSHQMNADSAAVLEHWRISEHQINAVLAGMRGMIDDGTAVVTPRIAGFVRAAVSP